MILSDLNTRAKPYRKRKRKGRGQASGMGKTCGRGTKGSGARSGYKTYAGFAGGALPVHRRFPKRGFTNVFRKHYDTVNVSALNHVRGVDDVDLEVLAAQGLVNRRHGKLKVLGDGKLERKLIVRAARFTESARRQIEEQGGEARTV